MTADGTLAWFQDRAYVWTDPAEGWSALAPAPSHITDGFAVPGGVLVVAGGAVSYWAYGDREWTWWQRKPAFPGITMPVGGWLLGEVPGEDGNELALLRCGEEGLQWVASVQGPSSPVAGWVDSSSDGSSENDGTGGATLYVVGSEIREYDLSLGSSSPEPRLTGERGVEAPRRKPPGHFEFDSSHPPHVAGSALFMHYRRRGSVRLDLRDGAIAPLGVAPISKSGALWDALERGKSGVVARIVDAIDALPPAPVRAAGAAVPARLIDAHIETDGKVRSVLTRMGLLPEPDVPSVPANSRPEGAGSATRSGDPTGSGIKQHTPKIWKLWLGRPSAETDLCHALLKSRGQDGGLIGPQSEGPLLVEALLELVGTEACERLIEVLREAGPPETSPGGLDYDYNGAGLRQLAGGCGPSAASAVEEALTDESIPVRIAACWAAGALEGASATAELGDLDTDDLGNSALWPGRKAVPRDAIISNLRQGPPSLQVAAATTSARLDLMGAARYLTPLLREPPLLGDRHVILRETVLGALSTLSDVPETARQEIRRCARSDPSEDVRAAAARVLGTTCGPDAPGLLARRIGDMSEVSRAAARALPQCTDTLSLSSFRNLVDRWLLRLIGSSGAGGPLDPISSTPDTLLEDILYHRLMEEDQVDPAGLSPADAISPESLSASSGWFEMASWGLTVQSAWKALFNDGEGEEDASRSLEVVEAAFEELKEVAQADEETRVATAACGIEEDDMPERVLATCDRAPKLGRRLVVLAYHSLGAPREPGESSTRASGHQPLHERLRSVSAKPPPRERLRRVLWTLAREEGTGGALGLYVLALHGETRAEARLIDRLVDGDFAESPLVWTLLAKTRPFCNRADEFLECALNPYLTSSEVPLSQRWAAFTDAFSWKELRAKRMAVRDSTWQTFFSDCVGAEDLLPWTDRHKAALHLAYRCGRCGPLESLWEERAMSVEDVTEDERYACARDMLWARAEDLWSELWARWPQEAELWGLRMLGMRGSMEAIQHIETAMRKEAVPEQEAREAIRCIKKRSASQ